LNQLLTKSDNYENNDLQTIGGACSLEFRAETFEEMAQLSQQHGKEMFEKQDAAHLEAMQSWMGARRAEFDALPRA